MTHLLNLEFKFQIKPSTPVITQLKWNLTLITIKTQLCTEGGGRVNLQIYRLSWDRTRNTLCGRIFVYPLRYPCSRYSSNVFEPLRFESNSISILWNTKLVDSLFTLFSLHFEYSMPDYETTIILRQDHGVYSMGRIQQLQSFLMMITSIR